ncbi:hypothetical protein [Gordonia sihwensis]|uniref:hypothetical protein n=1 Tax=Gordonia sihwensis TaxID=173559 RepID=UPI0005EDBF2D|nr:hypothetical protein [Gordonia sihwensis]KJR10433.1 hypothetical protein UG54_00040 [Gordonia sihwensis]
MKREAALLAVVAVAILSSSCTSTPDTPAPSDRPEISIPGPDQNDPTAPTTDSDSPSHGTDSGRTTPVAKPGRSDAAVASVCEAFVTGYGEFSPFDFDPAQDWQKRWSQYATPSLRGRAQVTLSAKWAWTWQNAQKAFDVRILAPSDVITAERDSGQRVVRVQADRLILGINETGDKARTQKLTFLCEMALDATGNRALVDDVQQTPDGPPRGD